ncbi:hypothetical protein D0C16_07945 [Cellvibrio sp. KY-GH-1]|uniref:hypothetical protein n=1 Tax=Cellvibrio sp. KY-GH-1 TaxID=2303332 RepID=UPI001248F707|nr:hypothetical protein [Cellvibrio sp. KY-GH-1]QEY15907.1 hypothetical protein D0C16_07945 [Cellvibrio sp. KY-GH-1]
MSLTWVIIGSIAQLMLAFFLFMLVVFSAAGIANNNEALKPIHLTLLNLSIYLLPALCLISAGVVIYEYRNGGSAIAYWWYLLPVVAAVVYLVYAVNLNK